MGLDGLMVWIEGWIMAHRRVSAIRKSRVWIAPASTESNNVYVYYMQSQLQP